MRWRFEPVENGAHVRVKVRCGETAGHRPLLGELVMDPEQWAEFRAGVLDGVDDDGAVEVAVRKVGNHTYETIT